MRPCAILLTTCLALGGGELLVSLRVHYHLPWSRICPGQYYAEAVVFINIASILHIFDVSSPQARNGPPVINEMRASDGYLL